MKKAICMLALLAGTMTMFAQTKFHDREYSEVTGPVKSIKTSVMGMDQTTTFTQDGKMQNSLMTDVVYDADGYIQSASIEVQGQKMPMKFKWENGKLVSQIMSMMGNDIEIKITYDEKGMRSAQSMDFNGQTMEIPYTDYKFDDRGNWISRKTSMMGQEMVENRTIEYFE
ncbi:MAG: hypothetical protein J6Y46_06020 [Prevotella sp.]|nr:hypothetical protein [Prevotella sp.]